MSKENQTLIAEQYYALLEIQKALSAPNTDGALDDTDLIDYEQLIISANNIMQDLLIPFDKDTYSKHVWVTTIGKMPGLAKRYSQQGILSHIGRNIGRVKATLDQITKSAVIDTVQFAFINDPQLGAMLQRDYLEIQRSIIVENWKSVLILSGGLIETMLLDVLNGRSALAVSSTKAPSKNPQDINRWSLNNLIEVSIDINLVPKLVGTLSHSVREYRNLIHPGVELRSGLKVEPEEAEIAVQVVKLIVRELT